MKGLALSSELDICAPSVLTERILCSYVDIYNLLQKRKEKDPFVKPIITGDEKWVV